MNKADYLIGRVKSVRKRVVFVGDAISDVWVSGRRMICQDGCDKFVQDAPAIWRHGGAANALECLSHWDVNREGVYLSPSDWPVKHRFVDGSFIVFRWDEEHLLVKPQAWIYDMALEWARCADAVLLSDYDKGFLTPNLIKTIAIVCEKRGVPCVADCKRAPEVYKGCIRKCNWNWSEEHAYCCDVVTCGPNPPMVNGNAVMDDNALPPVPCVNHVGAGDCFAAHLALALAYGFSLKDAAAIAHSAGRVYVQHPYNRPPHPSEVAADMALVDSGAMSTSTP